MYAIVDIAGQQFKVEAGMEIFVNRLAAEKGASVEFDKVLLTDTDGTVKVGSKVLIFKKRRRKGYQKLNGHRQPLSKIQINEIA